MQRSQRTFKLVMATAGLTEGVISPSTQIHDPGYFDRLDYFLRCWIYPSAHGNETVTTAIRDSCNTFFCEIGYRLSLVGKEEEMTLSGAALMHAGLPIPPAKGDYCAWQIHLVRI